MNRAELRATVAGHLAAKGYIPEQFAWDARLAVCRVLVGENLVELRLSTKTGKAARAKEFAKIPRRGPPRAMAKLHGDKTDGWYQTDLIEYLGECRH